jgi:hypothetical protein
MPRQYTAACSFLVIALCSADSLPVHASQSAKLEPRAGDTSPEPWRSPFTPPVTSTRPNAPPAGVQGPPGSQSGHMGRRLVCGMVVWQADASLDPKMVVPVRPSASGANISNMPVIQAECSDR